MGSPYQEYAYSGSQQVYTTRMMQDYETQYYLPLAGRHKAMTTENFKLAREMAFGKENGEEWDSLKCWNMYILTIQRRTYFR